MKTKRILSTLFFVLAGLTGQAKVWKTIKAPEVMATFIPWEGEMRVSEVVMTDTATTLRFRMELPQGNPFWLLSTAFLMDEAGQRYPIRSAEGIRLNEQVLSPESGVTEFALHFAPLPKRTPTFDFFGWEGSQVLVSLGIHDSKQKLEAPTMEELSAAYPYACPRDWFKTDTVTIRGRIKDYDAEMCKSLGLISLMCVLADVFEPDVETLRLELSPDGTFEKRFKASHPMTLHCRPTDVKLNYFLCWPDIFAHPGDTVDVTIGLNEQGQVEMCYHSGSSKEVERWLKSRALFPIMAYPLRFFRGLPSAFNAEAERVWANMMYRLQRVARRDGFTSMEMQMALADAQIAFVGAYLFYASYWLDVFEKREGKAAAEQVDRAEKGFFRDGRNYTPLHRFDFDNPLLFSCVDFWALISKVQYAQAVTEDEEGRGRMGLEHLSSHHAARRQMLGTEGNSLVAQMCAYQSLNAKVNTREEVAKAFPDYLASITHPYLREKSEQFYAAKMALDSLSSPLPEGPSGDLVRSLSARYPGRILLLDFWGMSCGPCRLAIQKNKELRAEIARLDDVKLIFIAEERTAGGSEAYRKYVAEWLADEETLCLTSDEFARLQESFRFNAIPHYETITPDGRRVNEEFQIRGFHNFHSELHRLREQLK